MEVYQIPAEGYDFVLTFKVILDRPMILRIKGYDANPLHPNSVYFDRQFGVPGSPHQKGVKIIRAPMPISPEKLNLVAFDAVSGTQNGVRITDVKVEPLDKKIVAFNTPEDYEFFKFVESFVKKCGYLPPTIYYSDNKKFEIKLSTKLYNSEGRELTTPARVFKKYGNIEASKPQFDKMTIPMRMLILLHERSHFRMRTGDEKKADSYALQIYMGMGYPRSEAMYAFTKVFVPINEAHEKALQDRMETAYNFIRNSYL